MLMTLGFGVVPSIAQEDKTPPPELLRYIRQSKGQGLADAKIKKQAQVVGWPASTVDEALAYLRDEKASQDTARLAKTAEPLAGPQAPTGLQTPEPKTLTPQEMAASPHPQAVPAQAPILSRGVSDDYIIGSGDTLQISVWKEQEASVPLAVVRPDGKITVPLIKDIEVASLTPPEAEQRITERLAKFITDPNVTVVVATINSKKIYIVGAARKEGPLPYTYGMTVLQAISEAGGLTDYAKRKRIYIQHTVNGQTYQQDFNYDEVIKGQNMDQNIVLLPGDTVVIPH
jgi:polysaccharide export outer membrane protein